MTSGSTNKDSGKAASQQDRQALFSESPTIARWGFRMNREGAGVAIWLLIDRLEASCLVCRDDEPKLPML